MEVNAIEQLRDLKFLVDGALTYLESDSLMVEEKNPEPMAFDIILGGRFGITDLKKPKRE